jgi:hypothetical protein
MSQTQRLLDDVVWEGGVDAFSDALGILQSDWVLPWAASSLSRWALARRDEYQDKCRRIESKCDVNEPGVKMIYEHYLNICLRYMDVQTALSDWACGRR